MRDIRRGSAWPDSRPGIVAGGGLDLPSRPRPGYSWGEKPGQGGGATIRTGDLILDEDNRWAVERPIVPDGYIVEDVDGRPEADELAVSSDYELRTVAGRPAIF